MHPPTHPQQYAIDALLSSHLMDGMAWWNPNCFLMVLEESSSTMANNPLEAMTGHWNENVAHSVYNQLPPQPFLSLSSYRSRMISGKDSTQEASRVDGDV